MLAFYRNARCRASLGVDRCIRVNVTLQAFTLCRKGFCLDYSRYAFDAPGVRCFLYPVANIIKICDRTKRIYRIRYFLNTLNDNVSSTIKVRCSLQKVRQFVTYVLQNMLLDTISKTIKKNKCKKIGCKINFLLNLRAIKVSYFSLMP